LRGLQAQSTELKLRVVVADTEYEGSKGNEVEFMGLPVVGDVPSEMAYPLKLPPNYVAEYGEKLKEGDRSVLIQGGDIIDGEVYIPPNAIIQLFRENRLVENLGGYITRKLLVVSVSTVDSQSTFSKKDLHHKFFADEPLTLRSQYLACSHGKLTFDPAPDSSVIDGGVMEVQLDISVNTTRQALTNAATAKVQELLGSNITDVVDNVAFCHPKGSKGDWLAYAFLNYYVSAFNDLWCGYISSTMHEIGHTLGFTHSNQGGLYKDTSGYMGFSYSVNGWPSMCFNAQKHWVSGWYDDRVLEVDPNQGIWRGRVAAFVDYRLTSPHEYVVIKVGQVYLQYNRAKGMNYQTREKRNQIAIVEDEGNGSEMLAGLDGLFYNTTLYRRENFGPNNETLFIAACSKLDGDNVTIPDVMFVSIGLDALDCSVPVTMSPSESPAPSPSPSLSPSGIPTESPQPSPSPSIAPTGPTPAPSIVPSSFPSTSRGPSGSPSKSPTFAPTWVAPDRGQECDDDMDASFFVGIGIGYQSCRWLQERPEMQQYLCVNGLEAYDKCPEVRFSINRCGFLLMSCSSPVVASDLRQVF
jgi:hypothetical protein